MTEARRLVDKLWSYCNVLRDDGVGTIEYTEQLTYLLFLKMAQERVDRKLNPQVIVPAQYSWQTLLDSDGDLLENQYRHILEELGKRTGVLGTIFRKAQNRIQDPAKLKRLIVDLIDKENWSATGTDIKGDAYEQLLSRGADDIKSGAGQYFTPRSLTRQWWIVSAPRSPIPWSTRPRGQRASFLRRTTTSPARWMPRPHRRRSTCRTPSSTASNWSTERRAWRR